MLRSHQGPFPHTIVRGIQDPKLKSKEVQKILRKLCSGSVMTCFSVKKKPELRTFVVSCYEYFTKRIPFLCLLQFSGYTEVVLKHTGPRGAQKP